MLARVAENLYWLGRYLERADNIARLIEVNEVATDADADVVAAAMGASEAFAEARRETPGLTRADYLIRSEASPFSLRTNIARARMLAREVREHISREVFEEINRLYLGSRSVGPDEDSLRRFTGAVRSTVPATIGLFDNTVLLTEGREWFRCGVFIERADMTSRIIDAKYFLLLPSGDRVGGPVDRNQWIAILRSASALEAYRKRFRGAIQPPRVVELLMFDPAFPRSLLFSMMAFQRHFERGTADSPPVIGLPAARLLATLVLDLRAGSAERAILDGLHETLDGFQARLHEIDAAIRQHLFRALPEGTPA